MSDLSPTTPQSRVLEFLQHACQNEKLYNQLKSPYPANRQDFAQVAQQWGYDITGDDIDQVVKFYQFYREFQQAITDHESGQESLTDWLQKWFRHVQYFEHNPIDEDNDTIKRYLTPR